MAAEQVEADRARLAELERAQARRLSFDATEGWREVRANEVAQGFAQHWAKEMLAMVRQGEPPAFGTGRLREARVTLAPELHRLNAGLPSDASHDVHHPQAAPRRAEQDHSHAFSQLEEAEQLLALASQRRWGRIDHSARDAALRRRHLRHRRAPSQGGVVGGGREGAGPAQAAQASHEEALAATASQRQELSQAVADLDHALERTRPKRVLALASREVTSAHLVEALCRHNRATDRVVRPGC